MLPESMPRAGRIPPNSLATLTCVGGNARALHELAPSLQAGRGFILDLRTRARELCVQPEQERVRGAHYPLSVPWHPVLEQVRAVAFHVPFAVLALPST